MNEDLVKLTYKFTSSLGNTSKVKIEINTREHFLAEEIVSVPFEVNSRWFSGSSQITTLRLPALMGSKLRALYQRKKCRDLFDIVVVLTDGKVTSSQIADSFQKHLRHEGIMISRAELEENLTLKMQNATFSADLTPLLSPSQQFDLSKAYKLIITEITPLLSGDKWKLLK